MLFVTSKDCARTPSGASDEYLGLSVRQLDCLAWGLWVGSGALSAVLRMWSSSSSKDDARTAVSYTYTPGV
jgi:hypothetical protein